MPNALSFRGLLSAAILALAIAGLTSCGPAHTTPLAPLTQLVVRNDGFFDVNVSVVTSPGARPQRLGTVVGTSSASFPLHARDLQYGQYLVVQLHAIGTRDAWTSEPLSVDGEVVAILDIHTDPFGDCSQSTLHVVAVTDTARVR
jgi:hypothetical protein